MLWCELRGRVTDELSLCPSLTLTHPEQPSWKGDGGGTVGVRGVCGVCGAAGFGAKGKTLGDEDAHISHRWG